MFYHEPHLLKINQLKQVISQKMSITRGAVTLMVKKISDKRIFRLFALSRCCINKKGVEVGHSMLRRHRLIEFI